ncbi:hypothetical protein GLOIN_2v1766788 [Rhizophagus clarus]|uniref:Uncharacterized protein n=1 Tax=Rhizophagus clarus TaxID=94130 RepID=A0A8H3KX54_9GLOM|nr:hypothetical protein GLOIN_2v1766788 [Rhizophagus clarus]
MEFLTYIIKNLLESPCSGLYRRKKSLPIGSLDPEIFTFKVEALWKALDLDYMSEKRACRLDHWIWRYLRLKLRYEFLTYCI